MTRAGALLGSCFPRLIAAVRLPPRLCRYSRAMLVLKAAGQQATHCGRCEES